MEKYKKGGYAILDLESSTIYADSVKALESNKPIVVYDGTNKPYFADTIVLDGTNVVITKGGKTTTIANDNTITNVGDIQNHLYIVTFNSGDYRISFLANKKINDYQISDTTSLNDNDKNYLKSLKDILIKDIGVLYSCDDNNTAFDDNLSGLYDTKLILNLDSQDYTFDLDNPINQASGDSLDIVCTKLI